MLLWWRKQITASRSLWSCHFWQTWIFQHSHKVGYIEGYSSRGNFVKNKCKICVEICNPLFFSSFSENLHKFARFALEMFSKFWEMWLCITTIYLIFWESQLWILRTALITTAGSLFLFLITTQHSNIIYI